MTNYRVSFALCLLLVAGLGCSQRGPRVEYVEGIVTLDGAPVAEALVRYVPVAADGVSANGFTDASGKYTLTAGIGEKIGQGAVAGEYKVLVNKYETSHSEDTGPKKDIGGGMPSTQIHSKNHLPEKYDSIGTSGLTATVNAGKNVINLTLKSR